MYLNNILKVIISTSVNNYASYFSITEFEISSSLSSSTSSIDSSRIVINKRRKKAIFCIMTRLSRCHAGNNTL